MDSCYELHWRCHFRWCSRPIVNLVTLAWMVTPWCWDVWLPSVLIFYFIPWLWSFQATEGLGIALCVGNMWTMIIICSHFLVLQVCSIEHGSWDSVGRCFTFFAQPPRFIVPIFGLTGESDGAETNTYQDCSRPGQHPPVDFSRPKSNMEKGQMEICYNQCI